MEIFFSDPSDIPLPPNEVRIRKFEVSPWPDGRRVRVYLEVTPFQKRPSGKISINNALGDELASINIIETMDPKMEFTLHLRGAKLVGPCTIHASIFYPEEPGDTSSGEEIPYQLRKHDVVDHAETRFNLG